MADAILVSKPVEQARRPARHHDFWKRDAHHHKRVRRWHGQAREIPIRRCDGCLRQRMALDGLSRRLSGKEDRKAGREQLEGLHRTYLDAPPDMLHQEKSFELHLDHDVIVKGRMDQVNRLGSKEVEIVDYKTGKPKDAKKAKDSLQLSVYALAAEEVLELKPERLVFYNLTTNEAVTSERDAKALEKTKQTIYEVAGKIRAGEFPAKPSFLCVYCDYKPLCPAHEQLISIQPAR